MSFKVGKMKTLHKTTIVCNLNNIEEAKKLPQNNRVRAYVKRTIVETDSLGRDIGRELSFVRLNKDAYRQGEEWLNKQGVKL